MIASVADGFRRDLDPEWTSLEPVSYDAALLMVRAIFDEIGSGTVRQVYYVGSRRSWWEKDYRTKDGKDKRNSYQRVSKWLTKMREKGDLPPLGVVLEFGRRPSIPASWKSAEEYAEYTANAFRLDLWAYQPVYVEMWVEGEAIAPIAEKALDGLRVPLMMNRGHTSTTAIIKSARRLQRAVVDQIRMHYPERFDGDVFDTDQLPTLVQVFYVGDHDGAGTCMDENIVDRLRLHGGWLGECIDEGVVQFERIAVTLEQVDEYELEPDPKPVSKSGMGKRYFERFGHRDAWAFEALPPKVAQEIIRGAVEHAIDKSTWDRGLQLEAAVREKLGAGKAIIG